MKKILKTPKTLQFYNSTEKKYPIQAGNVYMDKVKFVKLWESEMVELKGCIEYGKIRVKWAITAEDGRRTVDGLYFCEDENLPSSVSPDFEILIYAQ